MKTLEQLWDESQIVGAAVQEVSDRIINKGFTGHRKSLERWLVWIAMVGAHPEMHSSLLELPLIKVGEKEVE